MQLRGENVTAATLHDALLQSINAVYDDVINGDGLIDPDQHPTEFELFDNPFRVVDGPWYVKPLPKTCYLPSLSCNFFR